MDILSGMIKVDAESIPEIDKNLLNAWMQTAHGTIGFQEWLNITYSISFELSSKRCWQYQFESEDEYHQFLLRFG